MGAQHWLCQTGRQAAYLWLYRAMPKVIMLCEAGGDPARSGDSNAVAVNGRVGVRLKLSKSLDRNELQRAER